MYYYTKNIKLCKSVFITNLSNIDKVTKFRLHYSVVKMYWVFGTLLVSAYTTAFANLYVWIRYEDQNVPIMEILEKNSIPSCFVVPLAILIRCVLYLLWLTEPFPTVTLPIFFLYLMFYIKLQMLLLTDKVKKLSHCPKIHDVMKQMKYIALWHLKIKRYNHLLFNQKRITNLAYTVNGFLISFWSFIAIFANSNLQFNMDIVSGLVTLLSFCCYGFWLTHIGQDYINSVNY